MTPRRPSEAAAGSETGQAALETILLTFVLITFVAAAYQIFLVNQTIYRSLTAVHQTLFARGFARNCSENRADGSCQYSQNPAGDGLGGPVPRVVWSPEDIPEVMIPVVGMFGGQGLDSSLRLSSNSPMRLEFGDRLCPGLPCKRTRMGAGTYMGPVDGILFLGRIELDGSDSTQLMNALGAVGYLLSAVF